MRQGERKFWILLFVFGVFAVVTAGAGFYGLTMVKRLYSHLCYVQLFPAGEKDFVDETVAARNGKFKIIIFGDSRARDWEPLPNIPNAVFINRGLNGHTTGQCLLRLDRDVISEKPDAVLIQAGINDIKTVGAHRAHEDLIYAGLKNICVDNITAIVNKLTGERIKVILLTILPAGKPSLMRIPVWSDSIYDLVNDVNKDLSRLENKHLNVVNCDALGTGGRIKPQYSKDALHLNEEGYRKLNETVKPALERLLTETGN